ncbi:MAG: phosphatidylglycerophosphatase A [Proteobacteria bacterium]|nr:phosphatidylglycerophosphatase A [Pseudomonadota bacterium]
MKEKFYKIISTGFYTGYVPYAPGTFGSVVGVIFYLLTEWTFYSYQIFLFGFFFFISYKSVSFAIRFFGNDDPSSVVCDEILGMWLSLIFFELNFYQIILAFIIFRFFDILKPFPIRRIEKRFKGPLGVILDDLVAGVYTKILLWIIISSGF